MEIRFDSRFSRDLRRTRSPQDIRRLRRKIEELEAAPDISGVSNVRKMEGWENHYRIRIGDYRLGVEMEGEVAILQRFRHRRDFYREFP